MPFTIRQATMDDLETLVPLFDGYRQFYAQPADLELARSFLGDRFAQHDSVILLASNDAGEGVGFVQLYPLFSSVRAVHTYLLNDLYVMTGARRQGVAAALLQTAAMQARELGAASLSLSTALTNKPAQALYESLGWVRDTVFCEYGLTL